MSLPSIRSLTVAMTLSAAAITCGGRVVIDQEPSGGTGGEDGGGMGGEDPGSSSSTGPTECSDACEGPGNVTCSCTRSCGEMLRRIKCAPQEDGKTQCICSVGQEVNGQPQIVFSGVCFETKGLTCDFEDGCCAKYFSGK